MGLLTSLLTAPFSGPLHGAIWVAAKIHEAADREFSDPTAIRRALRALETELESGKIDEDTYDAAEEILLRRLQEARG